MLNMAKIVAKLSPISAANPCKNTVNASLLNLSMAKVTARMATNGAKITTHFKAPVKKSLIADTSKPVIAQPKMSVKDSYEAEINKLKSSLSSGALDTTYVVKNKEQIQTILQLMYYNKLEELKQKNISEVF